MSTRPEIEPSPWRNSRFRAFAAGNAINNIGESVYDVTLPLLAYELTGSLAVMGVLAAMTPATLLLGPLLGGAADRWGSRVLVVPGLLVQLVTALAMNLVALRPQAPLWLLIVLAAILQVAGATYRVGWMTGVPQMFPAAPVRSRGTLSSLFVATTIIGPVIVASTIGLVGYRGLLWINLATFVAPLVVWFLGIHPPPIKHKTADSGRRRGFGLGEGWVAIRSSPPLVASLLVLFPLEFVMAAATPVLATYHMRDTVHLPAAQVAVVFGAMNVAALLGALSVSERKRFRPGPVLAATTVGLTIGLLCASVTVVWVMVAALLVYKFFDGAAGSTASMLSVHYVPDSVFGRASGLLRLAHGIPSTLGPILLLPLVQVLGTGNTFVVLGLVGLVPVVLLIGLRRYWNAGGGSQPAPASESIPEQEGVTR
ncbi:MFS transporter [Salinispora arenicola]|uniref:MFS transporter n=1 Tax=Salinispora arenicola TaxID=168697 RepID=UPI0003673817|nr:MFS transporter [Salinispora arenicola]